MSLATKNAFFSIAYQESTKNVSIFLSYSDFNLISLLFMSRQNCPLNLRIQIFSEQEYRFRSYYTFITDLRLLPFFELYFSLQNNKNDKKAEVIFTYLVLASSLPGL